MTATVLPAPPPTAVEGTAPAPDDELAPTAGAVALVVDDSVAAIAAAGWAARLAYEKRTSLVVVLLERGTGEEDTAAVLARVQPAIDRARCPYTVRTCPRPSGTTATARARRQARLVRRLVPDSVSVLVVPGPGDPRTGLAGQLARRGDLDLLVVPDLRAVDAELAPGAGGSREVDAGRDEHSEAAR